MTVSSEPPQVLVVDDDRVVRLMVRSALEKNGLRVREAADGGEALEWLRGGARVDLVVTDLEMPALDGFGLLAALRAEAATAEVPVIMITSDRRPESRERALAMGVEHFVPKPVMLAEFTPTVRHLIG